MSQEIKDEGKKAKSDLEVAVFANDPERYDAMFNEERRRIEEEEIKWMRPSSQEDVDAIMEKLKRLPQ